MPHAMKKTTLIILFLIIIGCFAMIFLMRKPNETPLSLLPYPVARIDTAVHDNYHGTLIADPYRWLEDDHSEETAAWVTAENEVTQHYLTQIPYREQIRQRLTLLYNYPKEGLPQRVGDYYFVFKNDGLQNQAVLHRQKGLDGAPEPFLDPNTLSTDGTVALTNIQFSDDNTLMAYTLSGSGSDWTEIHLMEVATGKKRDDVIRWVKFGGISWGDNGFYYSRYDEPAEHAYSAKNEHQKVYFHQLGQPQAADRLIYSDPQHPLRYFSAAESDDRRWTFVIASEGTHGTEILVKGKNDKAFRVLFPGFENDYLLVDCQSDKALFLTNQGAPNYKLIQVALTGTPQITEIIPEKSDLLQWVTAAGEYLFAGYLQNVTSHVYQYSESGQLVREVQLPPNGTVTGFDGKRADKELFYSFVNFNTPTTSYRFDVATGHSTLYYQPKVNFDVSQYVTEQVFYPSKDGTKIPMFLVYKKGLVQDGSHPTYLYAYGGFNISRTPGFSPSTILLLEQGGVYALANIRGGGEFGEEWHRAGMLEKKQNVFDDFIAAGEYLIRNGYTTSKKLAIGGGSNGGLLVGACMVQRPDLFGVAIPNVGVLDMLRYHKFTVGWGWAVEYGSSDQPDQFAYLLRYSPLHNIQKGRCYPATLILTGDHDDRVVPAHSFKFGASLQAAQGCENPVLVRIDIKAGHGGGKPISKVINEHTDIWSFLLWNSGVRALEQPLSSQ